MRPHQRRAHAVFHARTDRRHGVLGPYDADGPNEARIDKLEECILCKCS